LKFWCLSNSGRFAAEQRAVASIAEEGWFRLDRWTFHEFTLAAIGDITAHGHCYPVRLKYPDQFPLVPAWVEPQDPEVKWSNHQFGKGGSLCLELRPDNWSPAATGADVLRSAFNLLRTENPLGEEHDQVPSAHRTGAIQTYTMQENPVLIGGQCLLRVLDGSAREVRALRWQMIDHEMWPMYLTDLVDREQPGAPPEPNASSDLEEVPVVIARHALPAPLPDTRAELFKAVGLEHDPASYGVLLLVLVTDGEHLVAVHSIGADSTYARKLIVIHDSAGARSARPQAAAGKKVAVVGAGSVGSKVAESLVRSGVRSLVLVDGDVFLPGNLERHALDWRDVGFKKVYALKRRLLNIEPACTITVIDTNLDWQRSPRTHSNQIDRIASCQIIVDATGSTETALLLGGIAAETERSFVSVEVYEGGIGAVIGRSKPGRDPPFAHGRQAYLSYCEQRDVTPPTSGRKDYEAISAEGVPMVADDAAVTAAAAHAARAVLDVLDEQVGEGDAAWLLLGFQKAWLFDGHGHNIILNVDGPRRQDEPADPEAEAFAVKLLKEAVDATKATG